MQFCVMGIGEVLWDVFPGGRQIGGAPYNFAFHCAQLGAQAYPISCIGKDDSGFEIQENAQSAGMNISCLQEHEEFPTGTVQVVLNSGKPSYDICRNVAWDNLQFTSGLESLAGKASAVCFGTLGQRNEVSRETIRSFMQACPDSALKIFDINLRQDFFSKARIQNSLDLANILKLSDEELPVVADLFALSGSVLDQLEELLSRFQLQLVAYTRGPNGSLLVSSSIIADHKGYIDELAVDTVGAGDSFTAALCMGLLQKRPLNEINEYANRVATFVCSQRGATPKLPKELIQGALSYAQ